MKCQRRTDTSMGSPAMHQWELRQAQKNQKERLSRVRSSIDTRAPPPQPHLTLYGRDYVAKKKATTEAAFSDLKMIQSIARTMTRRQSIEERKGPVSLNADARKADIYRIMSENHRLLEHIDGVAPFTTVQDMLEEHKFKRRYVINASHSMRLSGEYDEDLARIRREEKVRREAQMRATQLRKEAAERMAKSSGSVSLPALTAVFTVEPSVPPNSKHGAQRRGAPAKGWSGPPGESNAFDLRRGIARQQAKAPKPREAGAGTLAGATEPAAARSAPKAAVRFSESAPPRAAGSRDLDLDGAQAAEAEDEHAAPHPAKLVDAPWDVESEPSEDGDGAREGAETLEEAALAGHDGEDGIVVEDDCVPEPPAPGAVEDAPGVGEEPPEATEPAAKAAPEQYEDDFDAEPEEQEPAKASPTGPVEPPEDSFEEAATPSAGGAPEDAPEEEAPAAGVASPELGAPGATEPAEQEPFLVPGAPPEPAVQEDEDENADDDFSKDEESRNAAEESRNTAGEFEESRDAAGESKGTAGEFEESKESAEESKGTGTDEFEDATGESKNTAEESKESNEQSKDTAEASRSAESQDNPSIDPEPPEVEPHVEPEERIGVSIPAAGIEPVSIAQPAQQDAVAEDQGQDEYEDEYEDDFVNENEALASRAQRGDDFGSFEESNTAFEDTTHEASHGA